MTHRTDAGLLSGVTVMDLGQIYNGAYCGMLLAHLGARVIKIEPPGGEHTRKRPSRLPRGFTYPFLLLNSNKESVTVNLKAPQGRSVLKKLAEKADVLIENFAAGTMDRLGVGYSVLRDINPSLIYASSTGYGSYGPYRNYPAMDITVQAMSGVVAITGTENGPPLKAGPAIADFSGGIHLLAGVLAALYARERTGKGACVEVAMQDSVIPTLASNLAAYLENGVVPRRTGNRHGGLAVSPYNVYPCADGHLAISCTNDAHWSDLCRAMARPDLATSASFGSNTQRVACMDEVDELISEWTHSRTKKEVIDSLVPIGVPCAPVRTLDEVANDPHLIEREMLVRLDHPEAGPVTVLGNPIKVVGRCETEVRLAPTLGADTRAVLTELLGLNESELAELTAVGAI